jgi:predicted ATP-dependent endonuclease of OLD family
MAKDARHLFGFTGTATLASRFDYALVSATASASQELSNRRGGTLGRLLSVLEGLDEGALERIEKLQADAQGEIEQIVGDARGADLVSISSGLTSRVRDYFPGAAVKLEDEISPPSSPDISVRARVSDRGGHAIDPDLQGHGLQRAIVIALLHEIAEREGDAGVEEGAAEPRTVMLAIEEPELYQHPLQARALATTLESLATSASGRTIQIAYSTHSPYFSRPALFADLRLCRRLAGGGTSCVAADAEKITAAIAEVDYGSDVSDNVEKALADSLREAIFARSVLLCEGDTDAAVLEGIAQTQGGLDADGVAVAPCGPKANVVIAIAILDQLEIPFMALFDGDVKGQDQGLAKRNRQILELCDEEEVADWPEREVRERCANFTDVLETDLADIWPAFGETRERVATELGVKAGKKDDRVYRQAAAEAADPPDFLVEILEAARGLAQT